MTSPSPSPSPYGDADWPPAIQVPVDSLGPNTEFTVRCPNCHKLLAEFVSRPYQIRCTRCKSIKGSGPALPH